MLAATDEAGMWTVIARARSKVQMPDLPAPGVQEMGEEAGIVLWNCERGRSFRSTHRAKECGALWCLDERRTSC